MTFDDSKSVWDDNEVQFTRLLAEVYGVITPEQIGDLARSMDLSEKDVRVLFARAEILFERIKP
jgi:hypothetical protein